MQLLISRAKNSVKNQFYEGVGSIINTCDRGEIVKVVWVVSYPRSGNTWLRQIIAKLNGYNDRRAIPDAHINRSQVFEFAREFHINGEPVFLIKTHSLVFPKYLFSLNIARKIKNHGFIYVYRHPLDLFFSALNFLYSQSMSSFFINGDLKSVDQLKQTGELDLYIEKFIQNLEIGNNAFAQMCGGNWLNHINTWMHRHRQNHRQNLRQKDKYISAIVKYEDIQADAFRSLKPLANMLGKGDRDLQNALEYASQNTKVNQQFFWKQKVGIYKDYLSEPQIAAFNTKYQNILETLGYE